MADFYSKYLNMVNSEKNNYRGAGFLFYQKTGLDFDFLLGLENRKENILSIFGGGRDKKDKNPLYTAVRETFEELFNVVPLGLDIFVDKIQQKVDDYSIVEKIFIKDSNEVCYFADINTLNLFIEHLIYHEAEWTLKNSNIKWTNYYKNLPMFIHDRVLKNNKVAKDGLNEIKKIFLVNWKDIDTSIKNKIPIIINKKEYHLRDNLNRYLKDTIIIDIINKK